MLYVRTVLLLLNCLGVYICPVSSFHQKLSRRQAVAQPSLKKLNPDINFNEQFGESPPDTCKAQHGYINVGQSWVEHDIKRECIGTGQAKITACIKDGVEIALGQSVNQGSVTWHCGSRFGGLMVWSSVTNEGNASPSVTKTYSLLTTAATPVTNFSDSFPSNVTATTVETTLNASIPESSASIVANVTTASITNQTELTLPSADNSTTAVFLTVPPETNTSTAASTTANNASSPLETNTTSTSATENFASLPPEVNATSTAFATTNVTSLTTVTHAPLEQSTLQIEISVNLTTFILSIENQPNSTATIITTTFLSETTPLNATTVESDVTTGEFTTEAAATTVEQEGILNVSVALPPAPPPEFSTDTTVSELNVTSVHPQIDVISNETYVATLIPENLIFLHDPAVALKVSTGCVKDGSNKKVGQIWNSGELKFTCLVTGNVSVLACIAEDGNEIPVGQQLPFGGFMHHCQQLSPTEVVYKKERITKNKIGP